MKVVCRYVDEIDSKLEKTAALSIVNQLKERLKTNQFKLFLLTEVRN
jgi:hypothetical protein